VSEQAGNSEQISAELRKVLNTHGHGFHYAVVRRGEELFSSKQSSLVFECVEFPVVAGGQTTHIDFILSSRNSGNTFVVAECKRADPAKALWCFARFPYTRFNVSSTAEITFENLVCAEGDTVTHRPHFAYPKEGSYHLAFELKTKSKGDGQFESGAAVNNAVTQVLRGTSGLINHIADAFLRRERRANSIAFVPAIFTTAEIWITDADLSVADLKSGELPLDAVGAKKVNWIWFTHHRSPSLMPDIQFQRVGTSYNALSSDLRQQFARTVAIVSPDGIDDFLSTDFEGWLW
jgi:hypothetical protein